jgi:hypothetical protein
MKEDERDITSDPLFKSLAQQWIDAGTVEPRRQRREVHPVLAAIIVFGFLALFYWLAL